MNGEDQLSAEEVKSYIRGLGADLVGVASVDSYERPNVVRDHLSGAESIVVVGVRLNVPAIDSGDLHLAKYDSLCAYEKLDKILYEASCKLNEEYEALPVPPFLPLDLGEGKRGLYGEVNHKLAGAQAGLGDIGPNTLLITHEYGPYVRLGSLVTTVDLEPDGSSEEQACTDCGECVDACPGDALYGEGIEIKKCTRNALEWGLPGLIKFAYGALDDPEERIGDQGFMELWQNLTTGAFYGCFECMRACPVGRE